MADSKRPRAFRLQDLVQSGEAEPRAPVLIEPARDPYEAEVEAAMAAQDVDAGEAAVEVAQKKGLGRAGSCPGRGLFWSAAGGLIVLSFGLWLNHLVDDLFARAPALGVAGLALARRSPGLRSSCSPAARSRASCASRASPSCTSASPGRARSDDFQDARRLVRELGALYAARPETAQARDQLRELRAGDRRRPRPDRHRRAHPVHPLDLEVRQEIATAARRVSMVTAIAPRAIIDVVFVVAQAIRLIRRISEIYGGRPGLFGFFKAAALDRRASRDHRRHGGRATASCSSSSAMASPRNFPRGSAKACSTGF